MQSSSLSQRSKLPLLWAGRLTRTKICIFEGLQESIKVHGTDLSYLLRDERQRFQAKSPTIRDEPTVGKHSKSSKQKTLLDLVDEWVIFVTRSAILQRELLIWSAGDFVICVAGERILEMEEAAVCVVCVRS